MTTKDPGLALPSAEVELTMIEDLKGPRYPGRARYMPHIVLGDPNQRQHILNGNRVDEEYLGIWVKDDQELAPGKTYKTIFVMMYWPKLNYEGVEPGATFTLREGGKIVGFGRVVSVTPA